MTTSFKPQVAVYYFPNYHLDPINERTHGKGWTEWELVKRATPRFPGHEQPKEPLWGYLDESKPETAERQIAAAADHGIDAFIYDWYWYDNQPFLHRALEEGYLHAENRERLKFALMWANHDWLNIFPYKRGMNHTVLSSGLVSDEAFEAATDYVIANYFSQPSYWRVNGGLYFSFYELMSLIQSFGTMDATKRALDRFRTKVRAAGLGELHVNAVVWGIQNLPGEKKLERPDEMARALGVDSVTSYVWIHNVPLEEFPTVDYAKVAKQAEQDWTKFKHEFSVPYFPNVSMGWDPSPRTVQSDIYDALGYPFTPIITGNTPESFEEAMNAVKKFLAGSDEGVPQIVTVNSWNEWTEGSYIEPDTVHGTAYLEAIRRVFGDTSNV
ncbi:glycosyltransferase WbsX family protein [Cohnella silvisoli]|uniref:Glycoside hydrolase family 99-like domain-containing protein n=1 Tax=Cohnella silvisoli TaxID=2873699 RepID=A0ABV1KS05_9BACL|nr:glycoside hydrolase family 99-like domain-containing protein [Cohnella silvisoli]MCD9022535.1 glycoside hydrolase family 99-like domain-containing protein [Cohnella silvisoli]